VRPWITYTLIRLAIFAVILAVLVAFQVQFVLAAVIAAVAGLALSYIFFRGLRDRVALDLADRRTAAPKPTTDDTEEDALDR
jgi:membrane protein implicated in regulation of membrane protease activity